MRRGVRRLILGLGAVVLLAVGAAAVLVLPRVGALRFLLAMRGEVPAGSARGAGTYALPGELLGGGRAVAVGAPEGAGGSPRPVMVLVHGVTEEGIDDGRLLRVAAAFRDAGFLALVPELRGLVTLDPAEAGPEGAVDRDRVVRLLEAVAAGRVAGADAARVGLFGISVGGPVALAAAARHLASGGRGLRALCLVGAPDDARRAARGWFAEPLAAPGASAFAADRSGAAEFARSMILRAALPAEVAHEGDRALLRAWLAQAWTPTGPPDPVQTKAAWAFAERALRSGPRPAAEVERLLDAAWPALAPLSPAHGAQDLRALSGVPVFLLHGVRDPLVPVTELEPLAARLSAVTRVRTLRSYLVGHTELSEEDRWENLLFLDAFFDAITDGS